MKKLYIVSTYHHALISCVKQLINSQGADILVTSYIPEGEALAERIRQNGPFERTEYIGDIREYASKNRMDFWLNQHRRNAAMIESQLSTDFKSYDEIYIFHDDTWMAHYLKDRRIPYCLMEDAIDSFKIISSTKWRYMLPRSILKARIKSLFRIGYVFCGYDNVTTKIEVNDKNGTALSSYAEKKLVEVPRKQLFESLASRGIDILKKIFIGEMPDVDFNSAALLLTYPMYEDGVTDSVEKQLEIYQKFVAENAPGEKLIIKPHPRDFTDYSDAFPEAVILDKNMPSEMFALMNVCFKKILSLNSTSAYSLKAQSYAIGEI